MIIQACCEPRYRQVDFWTFTITKSKFLTAAARANYHLNDMDVPPLTDDNFREAARIWTRYTASQDK